MRRHLRSLSLIAVAFVVIPFQAAHADVLSFQFDPLPATILPGDAFTLTGVLTNTTSDTVFLHGDMVSLSDPTADITLDDLPFFLSAPLSLEPNGVIGDTYTGPFLDITIGSNVAPGVYTGFFALSGGATSTLDDPLGASSFNITVTPEPAACTTLAAAGLCGIGWLTRRKACRR